MKMILMSSNISSNIAKLNNHFQKNNNLVIFLLLFIGVLLPSVSGSPYFGFFDKLNMILTNTLFNMFFFFATGLNVIYMKDEFSKSYNTISRISDYKNLVKYFMKDVILNTIFLYLITIILANAGAMMFCLGEFNFVNHSLYDFNLLYYLLFFLLRSVAIASLVNTIIYLLSNIFKNKISMLIILIFGVAFLVIPSNINVINHFYEMNFLYHNYFLITEYISFSLEFICSILEIFILCVVSTIMYKIVVSKKRDLV